MLGQMYAPVIPNVTASARGDAKAPTLFAAIAHEDPSTRARALNKVAEMWFESHYWMYEEAVTCTAFYYGAQWGYWSTDERAYIGYPAQRKSDHVRLTVNMVKPVADAATGILTQEEPIFRPRAASSEGEDTGAQQAAGMFTEHLWRSHGLRRMYRLSGRRVFVSGTFAVHVCWDPSEGPVAPASEASLVERKDGGLVSTGMKIGDMRYTALNEDQFAFAPGANDPWDGEGITIRERYTRSAFDDRFPDANRTEESENYGDANLDRPFDTKDASRSGPLMTSRLGVTDDDYEGLIDVYTTYVRSCSKYPRGLMLVYTKTQMLDQRDNPRYPKEGEPDALWAQNPWPVFIALGDQREQSPWGRGRVVDMLGAQRSFNGTISKMMQHIAKVGNAKVMMPQGVNAEWSDEIGQILRLGRAHQASQFGYLNPAQLGPEFGQSLDRLQTYMEYQAGTNSSTMGFSGGDVNSGRQENIRIQRDYGRLGPVKTDLDEVWAEIMRYSLQLFRRHATDERKVIVAGKNNQTSVLFFDAASLASDVDIVVENNQSLPRDPTERHTVLAGMFQTMAGMDPDDKRMYLDLARLNDLEPFLERMDPDQVKARRMCDRFLLGLTTPIFEGDDPLVFKAEIERFIKREEYERRVEREKAAMGTSPLEQMAGMAWLYYTMAASGQPMAGGGAEVGASGAPMADPQAPAPAEPVAADPQPQPETVAA